MAGYGADYETSVQELCTLFDKKKMKYVLRRHPVTAQDKEGRVKKLIGCNPAGEWQILIGDYSIIRGMVSYGYYEIMRIKGKGRFETSEGFSTPKELVEELEQNEIQRDK